MTLCWYFLLVGELFLFHRSVRDTSFSASARGCVRTPVQQSDERFTKPKDAASTLHHSAARRNSRWWIYQVIKKQWMCLAKNRRKWISLGTCLRRLKWRQSFEQISKFRSGQTHNKADEFVDDASTWFNGKVRQAFEATGQLSLKLRKRMDCTSSIDRLRHECEQIAEDNEGVRDGHFCAKKNF